LPPPLRRRRWGELVLLFVVAPAALSRGPRGWVLVSILTGGALSLAVLLRDPTFPRRRLFDAGAARRGLRAVLGRTLIGWTAILVFTWALRGPQAMFLFPRARPGLWVVVLVLYPVLSAYPQELMFRTLFFPRYGPLFGRGRALVVANALLFGWAHILVHSGIAVALTAVGGLLFATNYRRSRSTLLVTLEHALYGDFVFSVGIGGMFVNGVRLLSKVLR
jgi:membrane protease YdiL (CAAX protease family)